MTVHVNVFAAHTHPGHEDVSKSVQKLAQSSYYSDHGSAGFRPLFVYGLSETEFEKCFGRGYGRYPAAGPGQTPIFYWTHDERDGDKTALLRMELLKGLDPKRKVSFWLLQVWDGEKDGRVALKAA